MRYTIVFVILVLVGTVFAQENSGGNERPTHAEIYPEDRMEATNRDMAAIRGKINEIKEVVQADYEVLLVTNPEATGVITVSFSITPEGTVTDASVQCPEDLASLQEGVLAKLESLEFEAEAEQTEDIPVTVPFTLVPPQ